MVNGTFQQSVVCILSIFPYSADRYDCIYTCLYHIMKWICVYKYIYIYFINIYTYIQYKCIYFKYISIYIDIYLHMLYTYIYLYKYIHTIVELYWRKTTTNIDVNNRRTCLWFFLCPPQMNSSPGNTMMYTVLVSILVKQQLNMVSEVLLRPCEAVEDGWARRSHTFSSGFFHLCTRRSWISSLYLCLFGLGGKRLSLI